MSFYSDWMEERAEFINEKSRDFNPVVYFPDNDEFATKEQQIEALKEDLKTYKSHVFFVKEEFRKLFEQLENM